MLKLSLRSLETFDEATETFDTIGGVDVELEHSLYSVSKWEERNKKPFEKMDFTFEVLMGYIECMCITPDIPSKYWVCLTRTQLAEVMEYIKDPHTATTISNLEKKAGKSKVITAELVYSWMFSLGIPMECQHWHFNKLLTLINVCTIQQMPPKKMSRKKAAQQQRELNAQRLAKYNTRG